MTKKLRPEKKKKKESSNITKKVIRIGWTVFFAGVASAVLIFSLIAMGVIGYMPPIKDLQNPIDKYASQLYASDGVLLGTYSLDRHNRIHSEYRDLSPNLIKALIATEDARFYSHSGIDVYALIRAVIKTGILQQESGGGGSTITQQLAKQLYSRPVETVWQRITQKPIEWVIAVRLERYYTKEEIINMYFNKFDFLYNAVGIQSAAQVYFNKKPADLSLAEAATLVGMCKNPSYYNPVREYSKKRTIDRRNTVLGQMAKYGYLSDEELKEATSEELVLDFQRGSHTDGIAPYYREFIRVTLGASKPKRSDYASWQGEQYRYDSIQWETNPMYGWASKTLKPDGTPYNLGADGLKIYGTVHSKMQEYAEDAVSKHLGEDIQPRFHREKKGRSYAPFSYSVSKQVDELMLNAMRTTDRYRGLKKQGLPEDKIIAEFHKPVEMKVFSWQGENDTIMTPMDSIRYHKSFLRAGFMAMDTHTGHVKAYVGGIDYKTFKYDMVTKGRRQTGSTFKPFLYALAMEEGMTPCDTMLHVEQTLYDENGTPWSPKNIGAKRVGEVVSIKWGLQQSSNWVTAYVMKHTSPYTLERWLRAFGITGHIDPVISMSLGTDDISVAEMAGSYTAFANKGIRANPIYITHIEDSYGNIIADFAPSVEEVFSELTYVKMLDMLRSVIDGGTGGRVRWRFKVEGELGGKTGTTQNHSDGWFMGFSPKLSVACWVGGEDRSIRFDRTADGQGAEMALPIYGLFMQKVYGDKTLEYTSEDKFEKIPNSDPCYRAYEAADVRENQPVRIDNVFN